MAQSYRKRFEGREQEARDIVTVEGEYKAMDKLGIKDYLAGHNYFLELFNGHLPTSNPLNHANHDKVIEFAATTFTTFIKNLIEADRGKDKEITELKQRISELENRDNVRLFQLKQEVYSAFKQIGVIKET